MSAQTITLRAVKPKMPIGARTADEETALKQLRFAIAQKVALGYRTPQFQLFESAVEMVADATEESWQALMEKAADAINVAHTVTSVTPYIFHCVTESSRILPSDHRLDLKKMLQRRFAIRLPNCDVEIAKLCLQRCAIASAISAEKGAIHIARQNLGAIFQQVHECEELRRSVKWSDTMLVTLGRTRGNIYRAP